MKIVIIVDVDYMRWVNDERGFPVGDEILQSVLNAFTKQFHDGVRYPTNNHGDEFRAVMDGDISDARELAEKVRSEVEATLSVTLSIGVAASEDDALKALYEAKAAGRNRVVVA